LNKYLPYLLGFFLLAAVVVLFATGSSNKKRKLDERITLRRQDKIPYGTYVAYRDLKHIFPGASIYTNHYEPGYWDSLSNFDDHQLFIVVCDRFAADEEEMKKLVTFTENGNDVFICARYISSAADKIMGCSSSAIDFTFMSVDDLKKNMKVSLNAPPFGKTSVYSYPGKTFNSYFSYIDSSTTDVLGRDERGSANFIRLHAGKGNFYVHTEPFAFSNYFILHKNNIDYYEKALSVVKPGVTRVVWDEYYLNKRTNDNEPEKNKGWFSVLMNIKNSDGKRPFRAAFWLLMGLLLFYVLMEMRRKQRFIPVITKPRNDSLDFVRTIGRLYYDKGDHKNLCRKMGAYFLEHVRNKYKLPTGTLDDAFVKNLQYKSGAEESEIRGIVSFIKYVDEAVTINNNQLSDFHKQLESFYKKA
jgi:hypothetical protein